MPASTPWGRAAAVVGKLGRVQVDVQDGGLGLSGPSSVGSFAAIGVSSSSSAKGNDYASLSDEVSKSAFLRTRILTIASAQEAHDLLGVGSLRDHVASALSVAGGICHAVALDVSSTNRPAVSVPAADADNTADVNLALKAAGTNWTYAPTKYRLVITKPGAIGAAKFRLWTNGQRGAEQLTAADVQLTADGVIDVQFTVAGGTQYSTGDTWTFASSGYAIPVMADVQAALQALIDSPHPFEWVSLAGPSASPIWATCLAKINAAPERGRYCWLKVQVARPTQPIATWVEDATSLDSTVRSSIVDPRLQIYGTWIEQGDATTGQQAVRPLLDLGSGATLGRAIYEPLEKVRLGPIPGATGLDPETITDGQIADLRDAGFTTARRHYGRRGIYMTSGRMATEADSDFRDEERRRVMDAACRRVHQRLLTMLGSDIELNADGTLANPAHLAAVAGGPLREMERRLEIAAGTVTIDPDQNLLSTETLDFEVRIVPRAKASDIRAKIGFRNPLLQAEAITGGDVIDGS